MLISKSLAPLKVDKKLEQMFWSALALLIKQHNDESHRHDPRLWRNICIVSAMVPRTLFRILNRNADIRVPSAVPVLVGERGREIGRALAYVRLLCKALYARFSLAHSILVVETLDLKLWRESIPISKNKTMLIVDRSCGRLTRLLIWIRSVTSCVARSMALTVSVLSPGLRDNLSRPYLPTHFRHASFPAVELEDLPF
jgi:hypothetical protein